MESVSGAGRRAADAVLDGACSRETPVKVFGPDRPPEREPLERIDADCHKRGELLDVKAITPLLGR